MAAYIKTPDQIRELLRDAFDDVAIYAQGAIRVSEIDKAVNRVAAAWEADALAHEDQLIETFGIDVTAAQS